MAFQDLDSLVDSLDDGDADYADAWQPSPGDILAGKVQTVSIRDNHDYDPYPIVTVETEDGNRLAFHAAPTVAKQEVQDKSPNPGDLLAVRYDGERKSQNSGRTYKAFTVRVKRAEGAEDMPW